MKQPERHPVRPTPVDANPSGRLEEVLGLLDDLSEVATRSQALFRGIEQVTGLRVGELHVMLAVADGNCQVRDVARRIGQPDAAAATTVEGLVQRGMLRWHGHRTPTSGDSPLGLRLTDIGAAVLEQTQGVQIRLLDALVGELGQHGADAFRTTLRAVAGVLRTAGNWAGSHESSTSRDRALNAS